ncbi:MAG: hypothetical protein J6V30_06425 [Paludibacteraceae bacterium]|nr:hypothetical protein [Paludibacteraceae bacterium]
MPYRRLPNTDQSRLRALRTALEENDKIERSSDKILTFRIASQAKAFLIKFEGQLTHYHHAFEEQVNANKRYQEQVKKVRLYISHFIQVLNFCVIRKEIKAEHKLFYGLEPDDFTVPDLSTENALLEWGQKIIDGEEKRRQKGGAPLYNPSIGNVRGYYDNLKNSKERQKIYQQNTNRYLQEMANNRTAGDEIILEMWNEIEERFAHLLPYKKLCECQRFGIVYYYRRNEKPLTEETDRQYQQQLSLNIEIEEQKFNPYK